MKRLAADQALTGTLTQVGLLGFTMKPNKTYAVKASIRATGGLASVLFVGPSDLVANGLVTNGREGYLRTSHVVGQGGVVIAPEHPEQEDYFVAGLPVYADLIVSSATGGTFCVKAENYDDDSTIVAGSVLLYEQSTNA